MHYHQMFGFRDFTTDPRSGRPQPHTSWLGERLITCTAWASAAFSLVGAIAYYQKWHEMDGAAEMTLAAVLFALIASWRQSMLARKRANYHDAVAAYEAMLSQSVG
ncbi:hypothetical protein [Novosphingobium sp. FKTRR1]|uniref:hypothetical protein n=1 Tax=Novosphingobium sp. FKTRR1 TaxID=2879118 RepID=UPI001CF00E27|nr:hypothetical protein [Novosphingobium sp. FKTRR1]